jgi:hypothetical protein
VQAAPQVARQGERCACGGTIGPDGLCDRCRARAQAAGGTLSPAAVLALQRGAGNRAVAAMLQRQVAPTPAAAGKLQRTGPHEGEDAGCGFCIDPAAAGLIAHTMVQARMGHLGVDSELRVAAGEGPGGRLDLGRWDDKLVEIGEIKPGHDEGMALGKEDLRFYEDRLRSSEDPKFKGKDVRRLAEPPPGPQPFPNTGVALPEPQMMHTKLDSGVYGYWCEPSTRTYFVGAQLVHKGDKKIPKAALDAKKAFFDSDCIREKTKRKPEQVERVRIRDRAGATRLATPPMAMAILQSRAYHLRRELSLLSGEHKLAYEHWQRTILMGALLGSPMGAGAALAALWTGMPALEIWSRAEAAAAKTTTAGDVKALGHALAELEEAIVAPRHEFLAWKAHRDGTPAPKDPYDTPAPAAGAGTPQAQAPPPLPPPAAQHGQGAAVPATAGAQGEGGLSAFEIAALAALVVATFLILQPEIGAAAVAAEVADVTATAGAAEVLTGGAATAAEAALESAAYEYAAETVAEGVMSAAL